MRKAILNFNQQFAFEPKLENAAGLGPFQRFIVAGMGGSHLAADALSVADPAIDVRVHSDYGLPAVAERDRKDTLVVLSSVSGNTEEVLDAFETAERGGLNIVAISRGGKLLEKARAGGKPFIELPASDLEPRMVLGHSFLALFKACNKEQLLAEAKKLVSFDPGQFETAGKELAKKLNGWVPLVYSSRFNFPLAYNWKIKFNETAKIPAFCDFLPELNHNEMNGFDHVPATQKLSPKFHFIFLRDRGDDSRILKRMDILEKMLRDRGFGVETVEISRENALEKIFGASYLADWTAYYLGSGYGVEVKDVPMVEQFKTLMQH